MTTAKTVVVAGAISGSGRGEGLQAAALHAMVPMTGHAGSAQAAR